MTPRFKKIGRFVALFLLCGVLGIFVEPFIYLGITWLQDPRHPLPLPEVGVEDQSRLHHLFPLTAAEVITVASERDAAERQIAALIKRAAAAKLPIAIRGAQHSMGGHTLSPGGLVLDMQPFHTMELLELNAERTLLRVDSGARWSEVIPYLDSLGKSVAIMQSNNDFTVGGSISVNCHGWQHNSPPIAHSVESFRIITADGTIRQCSREENRELFSLALGGYGLFGVILDVELRVVDNEGYQPETHRLPAEDYAEEYQRLTRGDSSTSSIGMAYGRISIPCNSFLTDATITVFRRVELTSDEMTYRAPFFTTSRLPRLIFRASASGDHGKRIRWRAERLFGQAEPEPLSRNSIMNVPSGWFSNRDEAYTEILHEYFIPPSQFAAFLRLARPILKASDQNLLNITVRNVEADSDTFLRFARQEVFGLVMLFQQARTPEAEASMKKLTQKLIGAALVCDGTYYLPYRLHATQEQFQHAYPMSTEFFALKAKYDPEGVFSNQFYRTYGPAAAPTTDQH